MKEFLVCYDFMEKILAKITYITIKDGYRNSFKESNIGTFIIVRSDFDKRFTYTKLISRSKILRRNSQTVSILLDLWRSISDRDKFKKKCVCVKC